MTTQGIFITFEGGEGTGKSTQIQLLAETLRAAGHETVITREPGGTPEAEKIRELLVQRDGGAWTPMAEILLFFAARNMNVETLVKPALQEGKIVLCDRFTDSTRAYQSYGHGVEPDVIESMVQLAIGGFEPDLTFVLDIEPSKGLARSGNRLSDEGSSEDRFENLDIEFHERLRQGYLEIAQRFEERCVVIDADRDIETIAADIAAKAQERLS